MKKVRSIVSMTKSFVKFKTFYQLIRIRIEIDIIKTFNINLTRIYVSQASLFDFFKHYTIYNELVLKSSYKFKRSGFLTIRCERRRGIDGSAAVETAAVCGVSMSAPASSCVF